MVLFFAVPVVLLPVVICINTSIVIISVNVDDVLIVIIIAIIVVDDVGVIISITPIGRKRKRIKKGRRKDRVVH